MAVRAMLTAESKTPTMARDGGSPHLALRRREPTAQEHRPVQDSRDDATWPTQLALRITGPNGILYDAALQSLRGKPYRFRAGFAPGRYVTLAETHTGLRGTAEFRVDAAGAASTVRIELRQK